MGDGGCGVAEAARGLLLDTFPHADPLWLGGEERDERRVDAFLIRDPAGDRAYHVTGLRIDGVLVPDLVSEYPHIPFDSGAVNAKPPRWAEPGVFVSVVAVRSPGAVAVRLARGGRVDTVPVRHGHCVAVDWGTGWLAAGGRPVPEALLVDGAWLPSLSARVAVTDEDFRRAIIAGFRPGVKGGSWAADELFLEDGPFEEKLRMVECVLDAAADGEVLSDWGRGCLAAGPVENLIGHALLDYVTSRADIRARWVPLLRDAWWSSEPPDVRARMRALLDGPDKDVPGRRVR